MKNSFLFFAIISFVCLSCDGRQTKKEALESAVSEFILKNTVLERFTYQPEAYVEIMTDTLFPNKINVHIKNYALLDEQILISNTTDVAMKEFKYQRVFESEVIVSIASKDIFKTYISAKQFKILHPDKFWDSATLQHTWVNQDLSTDVDIKLDISFINPTNNAYKLYRMSIDPNGAQTLDLIEERS